MINRQMIKKNYIKPECKIEKIELPHMLAGSGEKIEQGGDEGGGHHGMIGNSMEVDFEQ